MRICFITIICLLILSSCGEKKSETSFTPEFNKFLQQFPELTLPLSVSTEKELTYQQTAINKEEAVNYLGAAGEVFPAGVIKGEGYTSVIYYTEYDPTEGAFVAALFDANGNKTSEITIGGSTHEVEDYFASVESTKWSGNIIKRKIEYHQGNGGDAPSQYAEVVTTIGTDGMLTNSPERIETSPATTASNASVREVEFVEYRSEDMMEYELYAIYPFEDAAHYVVVKDGAARLLRIDTEKEIADGSALQYDDEFVSMRFLENTEQNGIITFGKIELTNKDGKKATFMVSHTKRSLSIQPSYSFVRNTATGEISFSSLNGTTGSFSMNTTAGEPNYHICELEGALRIKGNLGYYQDEPFEQTTCKLIFLFTETSVEVFMTTSNSDCGCGANATLDGLFKVK